MRLDFASNLDGNMSNAERVPLDVAFVVDVSGSMGCGLQDDSDHRSKLAIAKECISRIVDQLNPDDRVTLIAFNDYPQVKFKLSKASGRNVADLKNSISAMNASGGTSLALGLQGGYDALLNTPLVTEAAEGSTRLKRVFFLTDMESSQQDEQQVIALAKTHAAVTIKRFASVTPIAGTNCWLNF